jgi:hypothetical protein
VYAYKEFGKVHYFDYVHRHSLFWFLVLLSKNTTYINQRLDNILYFKSWQRVSAVKSHRRAKIEQSLGTVKLCTVWDPVSL